MKLKKLFLPLLALVFIGCTSDDSDEMTAPETEIPVADFIAIGEDFDNVYQYDFDGASEMGELTNLTQELNVTPDYLTLREVDDLISFYYFRGGAFSLIIRDVATGLSANYSDFFANSAGRSVAWGINNESNVFFGFFGPSGTRNLGIQDVELISSDIQDTAIDVDIDFVYQPLLFNNKIYFAYLDNQGNYKFTFYDTSSNLSGPILNFNSVQISFLVAESGDIAIVKNGVNASLELYDADTLSLLDEISLEFNTAFSAGPVDGAVFDNGVLYYAFPYVQPSQYPSGPAVFDTETQENTLVDLFSIAAGVEQELGSTIGLTVQIYDAIQDVFLVGYEVLDQSAGGGVLQISAEGALISNTPTTFVPTYFVRN
jgi:hypothetical protein